MNPFEKLKAELAEARSQLHTDFEWERLTKELENAKAENEKLNVALRWNLGNEIAKNELRDLLAPTIEAIEAAKNLGVKLPFLDVELARLRTLTK